MNEILAGLLILSGGVFALVATLGIIRLPDVLTRMHASTKAGTLAGTLILTAVAVRLPEISVTAKCLAAVLFLFLTAPLAAHMIGRASYRDAKQRQEKPALLDSVEGDNSGDIVRHIPEKHLKQTQRSLHLEPPELSGEKSSTPENEKPDKPPYE
ncbi:MAG: monovalent cation/H(+) antiporter subunit G [Candidatus Dadabacteria bacterium]|nr:monovalent cation/H(+) antiporter subunit G [Candidatus Dadabacteria bacterium]MCY4262323.1 monovalent cation/H(+) antiporter subunit G [Candidatus Dadabacteria bacterium]